MAARAISYLRFSTPEQSLGDSERRQMELAEKYCHEHGLTLAPEDDLRDLGLSAYRGLHRKEGAFADLLAAIRAGAIPRGTVLIVEAWDRMSREVPMRALHQMTEIILAGVRIVTLRDSAEHDEASISREPYRLFHSLSLMIAAHADSQLKSERVGKAWDNKRNRAAEGNHILTRIRPAWVDIVDGKLVANGERSAIVKRIFREVASGMGCYSVAKRLQREGVPPLSGNKKSNGWNKSRILAIVRSDAPLGVLHTHTRGEDGKTRVSGAKIEGYYPIIVEQTQANEARRSIDSRHFGGRGAGRKGKVLSNLLTGIARCGECGGTMYLAHRSPERGKGGWLRCTNASRSNKCTNNTGIAYKPLEESLLREVQVIQSIQVLLPKSDPTQALTERLAEKEAEYKRTDDTITALSTAFGTNPLKAISDQIMQRSQHRDTIEQEITELRERLEQIRHEATKPDLFLEREQVIAQMMSVSPRERYEARSRVARAFRDTIQTMNCHANKDINLTFVPSKNVLVDEFIERDMPDTMLIRDELSIEQPEPEYYPPRAKRAKQVARGQFFAPTKTVESMVSLVVKYTSTFGVDLAPKFLMTVGSHEAIDVTGLEPAEIARALHDPVQLIGRGVRRRTPDRP
jgi:DNA invertase Pin-like site-specific DNA recombinase